MAELKRPRWKADDEHRAAARRIEHELSTDAFQEVCDKYRWNVYGVGKLNVENLEDGPPDGDSDKAALYEQAAQLYEDDVWPIAVVDEQGRRYDIEIEVTVRPIPDVARQVADNAEMVADLQRRLGRGQQELPLTVPDGEASS